MIVRISPDGDYVIMHTWAVIVLFVAIVALLITCVTLLIRKR